MQQATNRPSACTREGIRWVPTHTLSASTTRHISLGRLIKMVLQCALQGRRKDRRRGKRSAGAERAAVAEWCACSSQGLAACSDRLSRCRHPLGPLCGAGGLAVAAVAVVVVVVEAGALHSEEERQQSSKLGSKPRVSALTPLSWLCCGRAHTFSMPPPISLSFPPPHEGQRGRQPCFKHVLMRAISSFFGPPTCVRTSKRTGSSQVAASELTTTSAHLLSHAHTDPKCAFVCSYQLLVCFQARLELIDAHRLQRGVHGVSSVIVLLLLVIVSGSSSGGSLSTCTDSADPRKCK